MSFIKGPYPLGGGLWIAVDKACTGKLFGEPYDVLVSNREDMSDGYYFSANMARELLRFCMDFETEAEKNREETKKILDAWKAELETGQEAT